MKRILTKKAFGVFSTIVTLAASAIVSKGIDKRYEKRTGQKPPKNPEAGDVSTKQVLIYTAATAAATVAAQIFVRKALTKGWKKANGELPSDLG
jgi:hypothetical protein